VNDNILTDKRIILAITGSIAAYKAASLASKLTQAGALVDVLMTESAQRFITPLTFQALTGRPVYTDMWAADQSGRLGTHIAHVGLAHQADLLLIAPCTAHTLAKLALGLSDDFLGVTAIAATCPVVIAPAMDAGMYENPATQSHVDTLISRGVVFAGPTTGRMASGFEGLGRLVEPEEIYGWCRVALGQHSGLLVGKRIVVSAARTQEPLDPVRYISNYSSGRQGYAIAQAAVDAGADVTLITGPTHLAVPTGVHKVSVQTAQQMRDAVIEFATGSNAADTLIMSAAVADFRPANLSEQKIKKQGGLPTIELTKNPDILFDVSQQPQRPRVTVGFAAESQDLIDNARGKLERKKLDLIVANDITAADAGFATETNRVHFITADGVEELPLMSKTSVAVHIIEWVADRLVT